MNSIEKFTELKRLYSLKSEYHKRKLEASALEIRAKLEGNGFISEVTKVTSGIISLYNTFNTPASEDNE